jgi:hypothetical protein
VSDRGEVVTVYNLSVGEYHTYFVGSSAWGFSVWAHNAQLYEVLRLPNRKFVVFNTETLEPVTGGGPGAKLFSEAEALAEAERLNAQPGAQGKGNPHWWFANPGEETPAAQLARSVVDGSTSGKSALTPEQINAYADAYASAVRANGGRTPRGVWDRIANGRRLSEADKGVIRDRILSNPEEYPDISIKPRGMDGPIGNLATQTLEGDLARHLEGQGWKLKAGAGSGQKQEWIPGSGPGRTGGTAVDVTAERMVDGQLQRVRVQTVTTLADGKTPTLIEEAAAARIRAAFPNDRLIVVPKGAPQSVWQALLAGL